MRVVVKIVREAGVGDLQHHLKNLLHNRLVCCLEEGQIMWHSWNRSCDCKWDRLEHHVTHNETDHEPGHVTIISSVCVCVLCEALHSLGGDGWMRHLRC